MSAREVNFDGLIGPTHNYGGLAVGNLASNRNAKAVSYPRRAALQGLEKMRTLMNMGYLQGFIPPQLRPDISALKRLGFRGPEMDVIRQVAETAPELLPMVYSASSMWAANAATVTPSADSADGRVHLTPANLITTAHRTIESRQTWHHLKLIFADPHCFSVHQPLPGMPRFADEGAANHTRLTTAYDKAGVGLFVYGRDEKTDLTQLRYPARQTLEASRALVRQHNLPLKRAVYLQQNPAAINAGAFHNDVVAVGNGPVLFYHEQAFDPASQDVAFRQISEHMELIRICVPAAEVSLEDAISTYLFNSQLLSMADGQMKEMRLIAPLECQDHPGVAAYLNRLIRDYSQPIREVVFVDVRQSMANGGGPACLRLRVCLTDQELAAVHPSFILDEDKIARLEEWVSTFYRESLSPQDLMDPALMTETHNALEALSRLLGVPDLYHVPDLRL